MPDKPRITLRAVPIRDADKAGPFSGLKIAKRSYIFMLRKKFEYVRQFKVEKRVEGLQALEKLAKSRLMPYIQRASHASRATSASPIPRMPSSSTMHKFVLVGLAFLLIFIVGLGLYFMFLLGAVRSAPVAPVPGGSSLSLSSAYEEVVWYGFANQSVGLATAQLASENLSDVNLSLFMYDSPLPQRVVLVNVGNQPDASDSEFASRLASLFAADGMSVETMQLDQLNHMPPAFAIYIVPSKYMPASLLGAEPGRDLLALTRNGGVVMFAGYAFTDALSSRGGSIGVPAENLRARYGVSFRAAPIGPDANFTGMTAVNPLYSANGAPGSFSVNGPVLVASFAPMNSSGKLVLIPQTIAEGWRNATAAADDFYMLIKRAVWQVPVSFGSAILNSSQASGEIPLVTAPSFELSTSRPYPYILAEVNDDNGNRYLRSLVLPRYLEKPSNYGALSHDPVALPTALTGTKLRMRGSGLSPTSVELTLQAYSNGRLVSTTPIGLQLSQLQYDYDVALGPGDYVLRLVDEEGTLYAKSYLHVPTLTVEAVAYGWEDGNFKFRLLADGVPLAKDTTISNIGVSVDNGAQATLAAKDGTIEFKTAVAPLPAGTHTFDFYFGTSHQTLSQTFTPPRNWWDETPYQLAILATLVVFALGYALRQPDIELYGLDVPDFPPLSKMAIPVKRQSVLNLFDSVNKEYKWNYMPLKISEIKTGFRKILYQGKGILIGDYNTERLMETLVQEGSVKVVLGLYARTAWEDASKRNARYLAIFRLMRDVLVNSAVRFSELNSSKDYDSRIGLGEGMLIHIYEPTSQLIDRIVRGAQTEREIVLFANDAEKAEFETSLNSTSKARMLVKLLISSGRLMLISIDELEAFVKKTAQY
ncbi:Uncharacterised protein [Candidatus Burarchaeum australiense]|nr:Uncharacterised protein [Candidatus Burarchaeum australiense]